MVAKNSRSRPSRGAMKPASVDQLGGEIIGSITSAATSKQRDIPDTAHSIYGGRVHLGWVVERGERYEAIGADRVSLGLFNKSDAAYRALIRELIMTGGAS